jgi:transcription elongation GreA/GreB family factor
MSLKDAYREKMEARIAEVQAHLDLLKARAKRAAAEGKIMAYEELADAEQKLDAAKVKLKEFASASEAAFKDMKTGMEKAWDALKTAGREAAQKYK